MFIPRKENHLKNGLWLFEILANIRDQKYSVVFV